ncbi:LLM class flavin-dependent oxidoreductase [Rhodococcus sp. NPDC003318]|uniref:LLM class flavin-dependent oxidoreductase n=1 Tax=Rhodococcus sp. NPDC003318 TaxID=3364503 RepID=UPI0036790C3F
MSKSRRQPSVAAELYGLGAAPSAWSRGTRTTVDVLDTLVDAAVHLDRGEAEYLLIADSPEPRFGPDIDSARPDALLVAAALALHTDTVGLIPSVGLATTEPYHVSRAVATLDIVSGGRGGWNPVLDSGAPRVDRARTEREPAAPEDRLERAGEHIDVTRALAATWAPDAILWDTASGRFLDATKVRPAPETGPYYPVGDASPTPQPPSGTLRTVLDATLDTAVFAAQRADDIVVRASTLDEAGAVAAAVRAAAGGRDPVIRIAVTPYLTQDDATRSATGRAHPSSANGIPVTGTVTEVVDEIARITSTLATTALLLVLPDTRTAPRLWRSVVTGGLRAATVDA